MKQTITEQRNTNGTLFGVARQEANLLRLEIARKDRTIADLKVIAEDERDLRLACEHNYRALKKREGAKKWALRLGLAAAFFGGWKLGERR